MTVYLYDCSSSINVLYKSFEEVAEVTASVKGVCGIDSPTLILDYAGVDFNYFYIPAWGRYYRVTSRQAAPGSTMIISGVSDPVESMNSQIAALDCLVVRTEESEQRNRYLADPSIPIPSDVQYEVIEGEEIIPTLSAGNYVIGVV